MLKAFEIEVPARFGQESTFDSVTKSSAKTTTLLETEANDAGYNIIPFNPMADEQVSKLGEMGYHRRVPLSKKEQARAVESGLGEGAKHKYFCTGQQCDT